MIDSTPTIHSASEGGVAATHSPSPELVAFVAPATAEANKHNTVKASLIPFACWRANDMRFKFESSFVQPEITTELKALKKLVDEHVFTDEQGAKHSPALTVFGHADPTGNDDLNKALSGRRAATIYGLLTRRDDIWEDLFSNKGEFTQSMASDNWGKESLATMLDSISSTADTEREGQIKRLQQKAEERKKLFKSYMDSICALEVYRLEATDQARLRDQGLEIAGRLDGLLGSEFAGSDDFLEAVRKVDGAGDLAPCEDALLREASKKKPFIIKSGDFLAGGKDKGGKADFQGCGEFNPVFLQAQEDIDRFNKLPDSSPEKPILKAVRDAANEPNRRVLIFLFRPGLRINPGVWPCPRAKEGVDGCKKRFWSDGKNRRIFKDTQREYRDTHDTFACRFYDRLTNNSPCEGAPTAYVYVWLLDEMRKPMPTGTPYRIDVGGQIYEGFLAQPGLVIIPDVAVGSTIHAQWADFKNPGFVAQDRRF